MNGAQPDRIGTNVRDMTDVKGVSVYDAERRVAQKPKGDFIIYVWPKFHRQKHPQTRLCEGFQVFFSASKAVESAEAAPSVQEDPAHGTEIMVTGEQFIQKPFSVNKFARKIREILGNCDRHGAGLVGQVKNIVLADDSTSFDPDGKRHVVSSPFSRNLKKSASPA